LFGFYIMLAMTAAVALSASFNGVRAPSDGRLSGVHAVFASASPSTRFGLETAFAASLVRRHAAAASHLEANPGFTGTLSDAILSAANRLEPGFVNLGSATSYANGGTVVSWIPSPQAAGLTSGAITAALAAGWADTLGRQIGRISADGASFNSLALPGVNLALPAGAIPGPGMPVLRTQIQ
jgi:hypothetical protein